MNSMRSFDVDNTRLRGTGSAGARITGWPPAGQRNHDPLAPQQPGCMESVGAASSGPRQHQESQVGKFFMASSSSWSANHRRVGSGPAAGAAVRSAPYASDPRDGRSGGARPSWGTSDRPRSPIRDDQPPWRAWGDVPGQPSNWGSQWGAERPPVWGNRTGTCGDQRNERSSRNENQPPKKIPGDFGGPPLPTTPNGSTFRENQSRPEHAGHSHEQEDRIVSDPKTIQDLVDYDSKFCSLGRGDEAGFTSFRFPSLAHNRLHNVSPI